MNYDLFMYIFYLLDETRCKLKELHKSSKQLAKIKEIQGSGTKVQIFNSCFVTQNND